MRHKVGICLNCKTTFVSQIHIVSKRNKVLPKKAISVCKFPIVILNLMYVRKRCLA